MTTSLKGEDVKAILIGISQLMDTNKDYLCQLDGALGDGDLGLTMSSGFRSIKENVPLIIEQDIGTILIRSGFIIAEKAPSTMGTLMASALTRGGKAAQGKNELSVEELPIIFQAMVTGIAERGKAKPGDKTILDSFTPAVLALQTSSLEKKTLAEAFRAAYEAAENGAKGTIQMQSLQGRAGRYLERSIGHQDPGATVGALFFKGFADYLNK